MNAIEIKKLVKTYRTGTKALKGVDLIVPDGDFFALLGANGAGKTTAIKMLCGLLEPTSGEINVAGFDGYTERNKIKKNIGYMSQKFSIYEDMTVRENIRFYGGIYHVPSKEIKTRTKNLLKELGFENTENKQKLSYQKIMITKNTETRDSKKRL